MNIGTFAFYLMVAIGSAAVVWIGSSLLGNASDKISLYYELPDIVQGAIVAAIGSSFPELSTVVVAALLHGTFELGVSAIVGSAIFNILLIPAAAGLVAKDQMTSNRAVVYKEAQFYMISVAVLLLTFSFAVIYFPVPASNHVIKGKVTRTLAFIPILLYGFYIFIQYQDTMDYQQKTKKEQKINILYQWGTLLFSLLLILIGVEGLVRAVLTFGEMFNTPPWLWGVTLMAAVTSVPDVFVSLRAAQKGEVITSMANVLGSNTFNLLICIPVGVMIAGSSTINYSIAAPMMGVLTLATIILFALLRTNMVLSQKESIILLFLYLSFVVWMTFESFRVIDMIKSLPPPGL